jgi:molybdenum cofactor synthesis domain-containing protein
VEIVTGAPIPAGADAVIMFEDTEREDTELNVYISITPNSNVLKAGTDIQKGENLLETGTVLGSREIGALAAVGYSKVNVFRVPVVAVLSTGGEVTEPGKPLPPGKIYDINSYSLFMAVKESGAKPIHIGTAADDKAALRKALEEALACADVVVTSGGASIGPRDLTPATVDSLGKPGVFISGVSVKPGKPVTVALIGKKPVFSLPGHPTAALMMFMLLARPVIQLMGGKLPRDLASIKAKAGKRMFSAKGRRTFVTVMIVLDEEKGIIAEPVGTNASGAITTFVKADGFVDIAAEQPFVDAGQEVRVWLFKEKA